MSAACNGNWDGDEFDPEDNRAVNFLALKHSTSGDIVMLVVNVSEDTVETAGGSWICFENETQDDYPNIGRTCWGGFNRFQHTGPGPGSTDDMGVSFVGMPPFTASLLELEKD